jgi:multiple sugar transport system substrate-binding protein
VYDIRKTSSGKESDMRTVALILLIALLAAATLAAEGQSEPGAGMPRKVALAMWIPGSGENSDKGWTSLRDAFIKSRPNVAIDYALIPWSEYFTKLNAAFAGGLAPDFFGLGFGQLGPVQANGNCLALDDYLKGWDGWTDIPKEILDTTLRDGKHYGIMMPDIKVFWVRTDMLAAKGLQAPRTPEEILSNARVLAVKKDGKLDVGGMTWATTNGEQDYFQAYLMFGGEALWDEKLMPTYNTPLGLKTMKYLATFFQENLTFRSDYHSLAGSMFENGLSAMEIQAYGNWTNFEQKLKGKYAAVPMPGGVSNVGATFLCVYAKSKSPKEAVELLKFVQTPESQRVIFETEGRVPARRSNKDYFIAKAPHNAVVYEAMQNVRGYGPPNQYFFDYLKYFRPALESVYYGKATPEEAFAAADKSYRAVVK